MKLHLCILDTNAEFTLHDFQTRRIAVVFTLHFLNTKYAKLGLASSVVRTSQVRLGSADSWGREDTSLVILQMEQQRTW